METNTQDNSIINALKRLERAGSESSRATEKLKDAARDVSRRIADLVWPLDESDIVVLPRSYRVVWDCNASLEVGMPMPLNERIGAGIPPGTLDYHTLSAYWPAQIPRDAALQFAKDLADGWLAELSDLLDARRKADEQATEVINNAKTDLG